MKRSDYIKLNFTRNWKLPGKQRLSRILKPSERVKENLNNGIVWLTDESIAIHTTADNYIEWTILSTGTYENHINKLIQISLKAGGVALDIGGNIGLHSMRMSQCAGAEGKVYAFEPLIHLQEKFQKNIRLNHADNVTLFPFALSDHASDEDFIINKNTWNQGTFSLGNKATGPDSQRVSIRVADDMPEIKALSRLDFIKIDVEGFEYQVLKGLQQTLKKHKPRIIFEYDANYWKSVGHNINDCLNYLYTLNYVIYQVTAVGCELITDAAAISSDDLFCIPQ